MLAVPSKALGKPNLTRIPTTNALTSTPLSPSEAPRTASNAKARSKPKQKRFTKEAPHSGAFFIFAA